MALHAAADHGPLQHVERGKQRRGAVTNVVVGAGRRSFRSEWTVGPGTLKSLDLALFVHRQHHRMTGRVHVEANDILHLLGKGWVGGALEGAHPVRLQAVFLPDALDRAQRDASRGSDGATGPVSDLAGRLRAGESQHRTDGAGGVRRLAGRAGLVVQQAVDPLFGKALLPPPDGG